MFCEKCGAPNQEDAVFCESCGAALKGDAVVGAGYAEPDMTGDVSFDEPAKKDDLKKWFIIGGAALGGLIITLILIFGIGCATGCISCGGPESVVKTVISAREKGDFDKVVSIMPKPYQEYLKDNKTIRDRMKESVEEGTEDIKKISYKITDKDKMDKDDVEDLEDSINASLEFMGDDYDEVKISQAYEVEVEITTEYDDKDMDEEEEEVTFRVYKSGGKWYIANL